MKYKLQKPIRENDDIYVMLFTDNNVHVSTAPNDPANTEYQAYLAWVAEGNVAEEWNPNGN